MHLRRYVSRTRLFWVALSLAAIMTILLAACGAEGTTGTPPAPTATTAPTPTEAATPTQAPTPTPTQATSSNPGEVIEITITDSGGGGIYSSDYSFSPATITVPKGGQVMWTNKSSSTHTVTSDDDAFTGSEALGADQTFQMTFNTAGTFTYHCRFHSDMTATITVT